MQGNYDQVLHWVLQHEGLYSNDTNDPGGATMKGVTQRTYDAYRRSKGLPTQDVRHIDDVELRTIYREQYAAPIWFDKLPSGVDYALFDFAVNSGVSRAVKFIQRIVGTKQDGVMGNNTFAAIQSFDANDLVIKLCDARLTFMKSLKIWKHFGKGWQRRVESVKKRALGLAADIPVIPVVDTLPEVAAEKAEGTQSLAGTVASSRRSRAAIAGGAGVILSAVPEAVELAKPAKEAFAFGSQAALIGALITAFALAYIVWVRLHETGD